MGKGTDKLYITHSEWASDDAFSASAGAGQRASQRPANAGAPFRRLPLAVCALSLAPFRDPVCTPAGTTYDHERILEWLEKHGPTDPVSGAPLKRADLIKLHFAKNDDGEFVDPVTFKALTDNTHVVALAPTGNVFAHDTVDRLNVKVKHWRDLVSDVEFGRRDIITLQDPQHVEARNLAAFRHLRDDAPAPVAAAAAAPDNASETRVAKAKAAVAQARAQRDTANPNRSLAATNKSSAAASNGRSKETPGGGTAALPPHAALHTTGKAAASFTSTGLTPHTGAERAQLSEEDYLLKPRRIKKPGYASLRTRFGELQLELRPEYAPRAVWNFVRLAQRGYYDGLAFHRNIRSFMLQGGDPDGTGKGGKSVWGKPFADELEGPATHDARGVLSMANKGKNTNGSQFFITYRAAPHLDRKHTIFGRVVGGLEVLDRLEAVEVSEPDKRPKEALLMEQVTVLVDPFEEYKKEQAEKERAEREREEVRRRGGAEDERTTWTGKRVRADGTAEAVGGARVGKYLQAAAAQPATSSEAQRGGEMPEWEVEEPQKKRVKAGGGFGNFDNW